MLKKDFSNAEKSFEKALELRPDYELAQNNLGILYILTDQIRESFAYFEK
jgi:Flp pilus assembly protein TadD